MKNDNDNLTAIQAKKTANKPKPSIVYGCGGAHPHVMPVADAIAALEAASERAAKAGNVTPHEQADGTVQHPPPKR
jgi:hypothetical protein